MSSARWGDVIAVFGGAFDPPHLGHLDALNGLFRNPGVREIRILPTGNPALKTAQTEAHHRLAMTRLNFKNARNPSGKAIEVDDREVLRQGARPSYTFDTLLELRREMGVGENQIAPLAFIIGVDQVAKLEQWYRFPEILGLCHWIALERAPHGAGEMHTATARLKTLGALESEGSDRVFRTRPGKGPATTFQCVQTPARAVSSTEIRRQFALGAIKKEAEKALNLAPDVESYLKVNRLYGT